MFIATYLVFWYILPEPDESVFEGREGVAYAGSGADPTHDGHLQANEYVIFCCNYRVVEWYPSGFYEWKPNMTPGKHRAQEVYMSVPFWWTTSPFLPEFYIRFDDVARRNRPTIVVYRDLMRTEYPGERIEFFTGSDVVTPKNNILPIDTWVQKIPPEFNPGEDEDLTIADIPILALTRKGAAQEFHSDRYPNIRVAKVDLPEVSSSEIRKKIATRMRGWGKHLPVWERRYIRKHKLHREVKK